MKERVEVIPADRYGVHCYAVWAPQPIFMPDTVPETLKPGEILAPFLHNFSAANEHDATDLFTTRQIVKFIKEHTGEALSTANVYECLTQEGFISVLSDEEMKWLARRKTVLSLVHD